LLFFVITDLVARYRAFKIVFSYSAIQSQVCNELSVQCSPHSAR